MNNQWLAPVVLSTLLAGSLGMGCRTSTEQANNSAKAEQGNSEKEEKSVGKEDGSLVQSKLSRDQAPKVPAHDAVQLSQDNRDFSFALYHKLRAANPDENLFMSPHSISSAIAMSYGGARGETADEMAEAMHFSLGQEKLHPAFNSLDLKLSERAKIKLSEGSGAPFQLHVVNAIWGESRHPFSAEYLDLLAKNYGAGLREVDFSTQPEPSREKINATIEKDTNGRIKDLLPQGSVGKDTKLVLTNAIYFKAGWQREFHESGTVDAPFHLLDGSTKDVKLMGQMAHFPYARGENYQVIELPYVGNEVAMLVVLPAPGAMDAFESAFTGEAFSKMLGKLEMQNGTIKLPKFSFESSFSLKDPLEALGMEQAFTPAADFSGMDGRKDLLISEIVHKSFVSVDEEGTEAAAATAISMGTTSMPTVDYEMVVDRPFLFVIYDKPTQAILFVGRVVDPG